MAKFSISIQILASNTKTSIYSRTRNNLLKIYIFKHGVHKSYAGDCCNLNNYYHIESYKDCPTSSDFILLKSSYTAESKEFLTESLILLWLMISSSYRYMLGNSKNVSTINRCCLLLRISSDNH